MRKLYNEFFHISKDGQISEKVMLVRITSMAIVMILCLLAMSVSAYAYFSYNVTSGTTTIKAATFEVDVSVSDTVGADIPVTTQIKDNLTYQVAQLKAGITYSVNISHSQNSTAKTGYIIITADDCADKYHTQQLNKVITRSIGTISFNIKPSADTNVYFLTNWGTSSYYEQLKDTTHLLYNVTQSKVVEDEVIELNVESAEPPKKDVTSSEEQDTSSVNESSEIVDSSSVSSEEVVSSDTVSEVESSSSLETSSQSVVVSEDTSSQVVEQTSSVSENEETTSSATVSEATNDEE